MTIWGRNKLLGYKNAALFCKAIPPNEMWCIFPKRVNNYSLKYDMESSIFLILALIPPSTTLCMKRVLVKREKKKEERRQSAKTVRYFTYTLFT